jgi:predicted membrane channel-forming protein YqfA (hemolysin III family)
MNPSWRKLLGILIILSLILIWAVVVASLSRIVGKWPGFVQAAFYLVMGIVWILPLKPLIRWTETGSWQARPEPKD